MLEVNQGFLEEAGDQEIARDGFVDTPRAEVEEGIAVDLAHRGAVGALHIVGVDFELRLGIRLGKGR